MTRRAALPIGFVLACAMLLVVGCATTDHAFETKDAHPGIQSNAHESLTSLPDPEERIVTSVYEFRDQTGKFETTRGGGSSFSRAVTQGATSILIKSLKDSDWFRPIERQNLSNLTQERDIIRSIRSQYEGDQAQELSPLLFAGIILEGGIIGFDTNTITGGGGIRIGGVGASGTYRLDQVTVYLRAVSTQTGEILKTVHTTKTTVSQELEGGAFRFVGSDLILEAETGVTYNEPTTMAVTEAIDASVRSLIVEGLKDEIWAGRQDEATRDSLIQQYEQKKRLAARRDHFDRLLQPDNRSGPGIEVNQGGSQYQGDFQNPSVRPSTSLALRYPLAPHWSLGLEGRVGQVRAAGGALETISPAGSAQLTYHVVPRSRFTPFVRAEVGPRFGEELVLEGGGSVGLEYMPSSRVGVNATFGVRFAASDDLDGVTAGTYHDSVWRAGLGVTYYGLF